MGVCSSCLGGGRQRQEYDEDDESRLLFDDPNGLHYGSFGQQQMTGQDDQLEAQREIEALQRVVARTSDNMVDIFEIAPHDEAPTQYAFPGQDARLARYQNLLSKLSGDEASVSSTASTKVDWVPWDEDNNVELQPAAPKKEAGPLVGTFADAVAER
ncbi:hypothetical protein MAPG_04897 [Magnaporthiopsis poae ATCC 64411]|uniref:Late endosomal/lysosomal adaptor and MAPK and MTOR activator domain-containing protein n=1 Tax=Magnaporthiopsis poae (strain ATCC 64411 / 73-15) TaxID=644358 RepID=A0A0C4DXZ0_MAGP6|nr:hypothetical protein MAPG_04897 [Magnaporthiopsis poae ATCC 64411]